MSNSIGLGQRIRGLFAQSKGPWGPAGDDGDASEPKGSGGPWSSPGTRSRRPTLVSSGDGSNPFEELLRRSRARFGGGEGGSGPERSLIVWGVVAVILLWLIFSAFHRIAPEERGVVTRFGRYGHTLGPGIGITLPTPIDRVQKVDTGNIRNIDLGSTGTETLMLTGDQNIIDIAYSVRWKIRDPEQYLFELAQP